MKRKKAKLLMFIILSSASLFQISCGDVKNQNFEAGSKEINNSGSKAELLTAADIERVTGIRSIKLIKKGSLIGAGGDLNFAISNNILVLSVMFSDLNMFRHWKDASNYIFKKIEGIGDEAYSAPGGQTQLIIFFRKADRVVSISTFMNMSTSEPYLNIEQMSNLAKIVADNM